MKGAKVMSRMYRFTFSVVPPRGHGYGTFPLDMLRYDACWPETEADSAAAQACDGRPVRLVHYHGAAEWRPNDGRWRSFGWSVGAVIEGEVRNVQAY